MTPQQYAELLNYIQENNSWRKMCDCSRRKRRIIKYVDAVFDSRTGMIWHVTFRQGGYRKEFRVDSACQLQFIYEYLDEEI